MIAEFISWRQENKGKISFLILLGQELDHLAAEKWKLSSDRH